MLEAIAAYGLAPLKLIGSMILSVFYWFFVALLIVLPFYFFVRRLGWLDLSTERTRWSRIGFLVLLLLVTGPAVTATGVVYRMRCEVTETIRSESASLGISAAVGRVALTPLIAIHQLGRQGAEPGAELLKKILWGMKPEAEVSFLLPGKNEGLIDLLGGRLNQRVAAMIDAQREAPWGVRYVAKQLASNKVGPWDERLGVYRKLLSGLAANDKGKLTWRAAATHAGDQLIVMTIIPLVEGGFNSYLWIFALVAALPPVLWIGTIQLVRFRRRKKKN